MRCVYPYVENWAYVHACAHHTYTMHLSHNTSPNIPPVHHTTHTSHNQIPPVHHTTTHITQPHTSHNHTHHTHHTTTHITQPHTHTTSHNHTHHMTITHTSNHHRRLTWSMLMPVRKRRSGPWSNSQARDLTLHSTPWDSSCVLSSFLWLPCPPLSPFSSLPSFFRYAKVAPQSAGGIPLGLLKNAPPPSYTCFRCGQRGHWIKLCPTNGVRSNRIA